MTRQHPTPCLRCVGAPAGTAAPAARSRDAHCHVVAETYRGPLPAHPCHPPPRHRTLPSPFGARSGRPSRGGALGQGESSRGSGRPASSWRPSSGRASGMDAPRPTPIPGRAEPIGRDGCGRGRMDVSVVGARLQRLCACARGRPCLSSRRADESIRALRVLTPGPPSPTNLSGAPVSPAPGGRGKRCKRNELRRLPPRRDSGQAPKEIHASGSCPRTGRDGRHEDRVRTVCQFGVTTALPTPIRVWRRGIPARREGRNRAPAEEVHPATFGPPDGQKQEVVGGRTRVLRPSLSLELRGSPGPRLLV